MHKLKVCLNWKLPTHCQGKNSDERWKIRFDASSSSLSTAKDFSVISNYLDATWAALVHSLMTQKKALCAPSERVLARVHKSKKPAPP